MQWHGDSKVVAVVNTEAEWADAKTLLAPLENVVVEAESKQGAVVWSSAQKDPPDSLPLKLVVLTGNDIQRHLPETLHVEATGLGERDLSYPLPWETLSLWPLPCYGASDLPICWVPHALMCTAGWAIQLREHPGDHSWWHIEVPVGVPSVSTQCLGLLRMCWSPPDVVYHWGCRLACLHRGIRNPGWTWAP